MISLCQPQIFMCVLTTALSRTKHLASNMHLSTPSGCRCFPFKGQCSVIVDALFCCSHCLCVLCVWSLLCKADLSVLSSFATISLYFCSCCPMAVGDLCLFLMVPWAGLQCVIMAFPDHNYLPFQYQKNLPYVTYVLLDISDLQFVQNKDYHY